MVPAHWWEQILHNQTALRLKAALLFRPGIVVASVPYHLHRGSRLDADNRTRLHIHFRLVMQHKFFPLEGMAQIVFESLTLSRSRGQRPTTLEVGDLQRGQVLCVLDRVR